MTTVAASPAPVSVEAVREYKIWKVIGASAAGTVIEWYDFYIFGSLATMIAPSSIRRATRRRSCSPYLATFAVGFVVRPFGALFFGRIGDLVGRKYAFLVTLIIMGGAHGRDRPAPGYDTIGYAAPAILLSDAAPAGPGAGRRVRRRRDLRGRARARHKRGFYTSFIQITATLGLFVSLRRRAPRASAR